MFVASTNMLFLLVLSLFLFSLEDVIADQLLICGGKVT